MIVVLANPSSSGFTAAALRAVLRVLGDDGAAAWPASPAETAAMAAAAAARGDVVVAMGGDGMVHHAARGVRGSGERLGIIPVGTTNVLARILGIPHDPEDAAAVILDGATTTVPLLVAQWTEPDGSVSELPVLFSAGVGWDADVVEAAEREPYRKASGGVRLYARAALMAVRREAGRLPDLTVTTTPDSPAAGRGIALQAQVQGIYTFAGPIPMRLAPPPADGFAVATWRQMRHGRAVTAAAAATRGAGLTTHPDVDVAEVRAAVVEADHPVRLQVDGEPLGRVVHLELACDPDGLTVLVPRDGVR